MRLETIHPKELGKDDIAKWRAHQAANESLSSPFLTPDWAQLIGGVRDGARVCIIEDGRGYFAAQRCSRFTAMGLGAPIADYQGVIGEASLLVDAAEICNALDVGRVDLTHVPAGQSLLLGAVAGREGSWIAETGGARGLYEATLKARRAEFVRQLNKKERKIARDWGHVEFCAKSTDPAVFDTLLTWKNAQLKRSGQPAIWARPWVRRALDASFAQCDPAFAGVMFSISIDGALVAAAFALRAGPTMHLWLIAHDPKYDAYSPGVQLTRWLIGWAGDNGVYEVDFGPGEYQYKRQLATTQRMIERGAAARPSWAATVRRAEYALRAGMEKLPAQRLAALPGKAMRRLDLMRAL